MSQFKIKKAIPLLVALAALPSVAQNVVSKSPVQMTLCSVPLWIGMAKNDVITKLSEGGCKASKFDNDPDSWAVMKQDETKGLGIIEFESNRLSEVKHSWLPPGGDYDEGGLVRALVLAVNSITNGHTTPASITVYTKQTPEYNVYQLYITLANGRQIQLSTLEDVVKHKTAELDVQEAITKSK